MKNPIGARDIIAQMQKLRSVAVLDLHRNELGPKGCDALFTFLMSEDGKKHPVEEITLTSNKIGNAGLRKVMEYLRGNAHLKRLMLQNVSTPVKSACPEIDMGETRIILNRMKHYLKTLLMQ